MKNLKIIILIFTFFSCKKKNFNDDIPLVIPVIPNAPIVNSITPVRAQYGNTLTILGKNFGTVAANVIVNSGANTITAAPVTNNDSVLTIVIPKGFGSGAITVKKQALSGTGVSFEYLYTGKVSLFAGNGTNSPVTGTATSVGLGNLYGLTSDGAGSIYLSTQDGVGAAGAPIVSNIRKIDAAGNVTTLSYHFIPGFANLSVGDILYDNTGGVPSLWANILGQHAIHKINLNAQTFTKEVGNYQAYFLDGSVANSYINKPAGIAKRSNGQFYFTDNGNVLVRSFTPGGTVATNAGGYLQAGDAIGAGTSARFNDMFGITNDGADNFLICDNLNNKIKKLLTNNTVEIFAGTTQGTVDGPIATAKLYNPVTVCKDNNGNVLIGCMDNTIRCITPSGYVYTVAGVSSFNNGSYAEGIGTAARFNLPVKIINTSNLTFLISDNVNKRIRKMILE